MGSTSKLAGKVVVITGAASKLGEAITKKFVKHGARVILADTNKRSCEKIAEDLNWTYSLAYNTTQVKVAHAMYCDVREPDDILLAIKEAKRVYDQDLDIFYNNAAINVDVPPITCKAFSDTMKVNVESVLASIEHAGAKMSSNPNGGCILCTGSTSGLLGDMLPSAYSISKAAVIGVVRAVAADLAKHGVRVNVISPHRVAPSFDREVLQKMFPNANNTQMADMIIKCMTNLVSNDDVANAAVYLASDASKSVTGQNLVLDGKFSL